MELMILINGTNKYAVKDKKSRQIYTIKKKGFSNNKLVLLDASGYHLYTLMTNGEMSYTVVLNDDTYLLISCKSKFLDPTIKCTGKGLNCNLKSSNSRDFSIMVNDEEKGIIETSVSGNGEIQYDLTIDDKLFDDYIPFFAVVIDKIFGDANRQPQVMQQIMADKKEKNKK
ncbi:MAG: hypothetical protein K2J40_06295 [Ruminococcus sp.]|nr:hypothetical protein [Ruminococcus sp.]